jgi:DNA polymerase IV (DinB-like DNA polymerase)
MRIIFHIDLDYFYAQIEERDNPNLKGKPVLVLVLSGRTEDSGVVATANYPARELGAKSAMPIAIAKKKLAPYEAYYIPMRIDYYRFISEEIMEIISKYADSFEKASIDEAYLEVTKNIKGDFDKAYQLAKRIQQEVYSKVRLTLSIGISINKLIAKIASGIKKPNAITMIKPEEINSFLNPLPVKEIPGVGEKTSTKLLNKGVKTIGELRKISLEELNQLFGNKIGAFIYYSARGIDNSPVEDRGLPLQKSRIKTLREDSRDIDYIMSNLIPLIEKIDNYLVDHNIFFKTISTIFITTNLKAHTKSRTLDRAYNKLSNLQVEIRSLIKDFLEEIPQEVRRAGIRASNFVVEDETKQTKLSSYL